MGGCIQFKELIIENKIKIGQFSQIDMPKLIFKVNDPNSKLKEDYFTFKFRILTFRELIIKNYKIRVYNFFY